jgi:N-acyl homoserine lactone hydrolase
MSATTSIQRLYLMRVAHSTSDGTPFVCYLAQADGGTNILIDTGLPPIPPEEADDLTQERNVVEQLAQIGLGPGDIDLLVTTHFDMDHAGRIDEFPGVPLVTQRAHYDWALTHPRPQRSRAKWDVPIDRFRFVDGDTELLPGLRLIDTTGHNPGHQSVLVTLPRTGPVLLAIDAVPRRDLYSRDREGGTMDVDGARAVESTRKLIDLAEREGAQLVVFGHQADQWQALRRLPEYYD